MNASEPLPARVNIQQVAKRLGFADHDIPILVSEKLLKPLGKPTQSAVKYFAACEVEELARQVSWLNKATQATYNYWKEKNARKSDNLSRIPANKTPAVSLSE